jgi:hypothetical protein
MMIPVLQQARIAQKAAQAPTETVAVAVIVALVVVRSGAGAVTAVAVGATTARRTRRMSSRGRGIAIVIVMRIPSMVQAMTNLMKKKQQQEEMASLATCTPMLQAQRRPATPRLRRCPTPRLYWRRPKSRLT